ncbi:hypothetical protein BHS07_10315 [Myxococcus xanthus]|nr:hypothetical protein BHS08_10340 [Myxococcus xanthus]QDE81905.1 hypothetical protein BHS07_10315 [Myxococcus xanthus]QDE96210.1 hypothetical protein BHS05_10350 [Myxococcus xanthus]
MARLSAGCGSYRTQVRKVLLIAAAQIVHQALQRQWTVALEHSGAMELLGRQARDERHRLRTGLPELRQREVRGPAAVGALPGQGIGIRRRQRWIPFVPRATQANVVAQNLDVPHVPDLLDGGQRRTGHAVPRRGGPMPEVLRDGGVVRFELRREVLQGLDCDGWDHEGKPLKCRAMAKPMVEPGSA